MDKTFEILGLIFGLSAIWGVMASVGASCWRSVAMARSGVTDMSDDVLFVATALAPISAPFFIMTYLIHTFSSEGRTHRKLKKIEQRAKLDSALDRIITEDDKRRLVDFDKLLGDRTDDE